MSRYDIVIVGAGPAGIFTALELKTRAPELSVLLVDEGLTIDRRVCPARKTGRCVHCEPCNIMSGWSGAGAFSDGKLSLSEEVGGNITDYMSHEKARELIAYADGIYTRFGAPDKVHGLDDKKVEEIDYECSRHNIHLIKCPVRHMGTEYSFETLRGMYQYLMKQPGFTFRELTRAVRLIIEDGSAVGVELQTRGRDPEVAEASYVVAAPGRGGADWLSKEVHLHGIGTRNNEVDIGVRVEVPNAVMDHLTTHLYEAKMVYYSDTFENKVRTFCMNPGGIVSEEHYDGGTPHGEHQLCHAGLLPLHRAFRPAYRVWAVHRPAGQHAYRGRHHGPAAGRSAPRPEDRRFPSGPFHHDPHPEDRRAGGPLFCSAASASDQPDRGYAGLR